MADVGVVARYDTDAGTSSFTPYNADLFYEGKNPDSSAHLRLTMKQFAEAFTRSKKGTMLEVTPASLKAPSVVDPGRGALSLIEGQTVLMATHLHLHTHTPTHPHTHTPTHLHTYTQTHPHTHTPTHRRTGALTHLHTDAGDRRDRRGRSAAAARHRDLFRARPYVCRVRGGEAWAHGTWWLQVWFKQHDRYWGAACFVAPCAWTVTCVSRGRGQRG